MFEKGEIPSLNGWRAVSVLMVLIAHSDSVMDPASLRYYLGELGVRFFFVISGFLITWLLLREHAESGGVNLKAFYVRRVFRILPVYYAFLVVCYLLRGSYPGGLSTGEWTANLLFLTNYTDAGWVTGHLWTLAVEEQFYILWPMVFVQCFKRRERTLGLILSGVLVACPVTRGIAYLRGDEHSMVFNRFSFLMQADVLAAGCLAATVFWYRPALWNLLRANMSVCIVAGCLLVSVFWLLPEIPGANLIRVPLGPSLQALGFLLLLLPSLLEPEKFRILNAKPVVWVGVLSYSIYIWHVLLVPATWRDGGAISTRILFSNPGWLVTALLVAMVSYYLLEKPFLGLRKRFLTHR